MERVDEAGRPRRTKAEDTSADASEDPREAVEGRHDSAERDTEAQDGAVGTFAVNMKFVISSVTRCHLTQRLLRSPYFHKPSSRGPTEGVPGCSAAAASAAPPADLTAEFIVLPDPGPAQHPLKHGCLDLPLHSCSRGDETKPAGKETKLGLLWRAGPSGVQWTDLRQGRRLAPDVPMTPIEVTRPSFSKFNLSNMVYSQLHGITRARSETCPRFPEMIRRGGTSDLSPEPSEDEQALRVEAEAAILSRGCSATHALSFYPHLRRSLVPLSSLIVPSPPSSTRSTWSQLKALTLAGPQRESEAPLESSVCTEGGRVADAAEPVPVLPDTLPPHPPLLSVSLDPGRSRRGDGGLPRSHSVPSPSQTRCVKDAKLTRAASLPDFEEFTPDIAADEHDETCRFQCSCPGLYRCSVTGLLFHMEGGGDVVYRIVHWDRRLLAQHHKKPAGPLFDISCVQQSVSQLHLPHCEVRSTGGRQYLSVAHVKDEDIEFLPPHKMTGTHVIINITGFSDFGIVKDEDCPADPVRALVLLFYRPSEDPDLENMINVLLLPKNVSVREVQHSRKKLVGEERYIETCPHCKLHPQQVYTLSTRPEDHSVLVQPTEAEFDEESYDNYFPAFQLTWETTMKRMTLSLRDTSSGSVWERRVCLSSPVIKGSCGSSRLSPPASERLLDVRSSFIDGTSGPVLESLLDRLLERTVIADAERESAGEVHNRRDKARCVIDTVRRKGEAASSEMIDILCELDPFLCEHLGLM